MKELAIPQRLIVAADYKPEGAQGYVWVHRQVTNLAHALAGTGVTIKLNSAVRTCGYQLIRTVMDYGLEVFADLKFNDIPETLATDGALLNLVKPRLVTAMCSTSLKSLKALKAELPGTEVLGVTVLTSFKEDEAESTFGNPLMAAVLNFLEIAREAGLDGVIASPSEACTIRTMLDGAPFTINTPGIRPAWSIVKGDDQNPDRIMTPAKAIKAGATRLVIGRPITQATNPREAVERTLEEIAGAL